MQIFAFFLHDTLVLLEQLVGEFSEYLEEGEVGGRPGGVGRVLQRVHRKQNALSVQSRDRLSVPYGVQSKRQSEALCQLLEIAYRLQLQQIFFNSIKFGSLFRQICVQIFLQKSISLCQICPQK
jgi:hypothetical protein